MAGGTQLAANGHSAFGSWALEQQGSPITDVMRALRQPGKAPAGLSSGAVLDAAARPTDAQQPAELEAPDEASEDDADVSWWDTDIPGEGSDRNGAEDVNARHPEAQPAEQAEHEAATGEYAAGSLVWRREDVGGGLEAPPEAAHSLSAAEQQPGTDTEAQWEAGQQSGNEAAVPSTDACSSAEEQWRLAYAQWYEAYMHWYASYTQWHAGYQQHCADQASGSGSAQADHAVQDLRH